MCDVMWCLFFTERMTEQTGCDIMNVFTVILLALSFLFLVRKCRLVDASDFPDSLALGEFKVPIKAVAT